MNFISRKKSVITRKENLENLHTFKNFPVFFGCTTRPIEEDLLADMIWDIDKETGIIQLSSLIPLDILYMEQHVDATGPTWSRYNNDFSEYVLNNKSGNILEIGGGSGKIANIILNKDNNVEGDIGTLEDRVEGFKRTNRFKSYCNFFSSLRTCL